MRLTIIPSDGAIAVDRKAFHGFDLSALVAKGIHAVQWYGDRGEVEFVDADGVKPANVRISDITEFQPYIDLWTAKNQEPLPPPVDQADIDNLTKQMKALALTFAQITNTPVATVRTIFRNKMEQLP